MKKLPFILFLALLFPGDIVTAAENEEIDFLLSSIATSNCLFIRNGKEHQAKEASEHLEMKYNYAKSRIKTAEIFIKKIASKSSITRKKYLIRCGSVIIPARQWLERALASHRISVERRGLTGEK